MTDKPMRWAVEAAGDVVYLEGDELHGRYTSVMGKGEAARMIEQAAEPLLAVVRQCLRETSSGPWCELCKKHGHYDGCKVPAALKAMEVSNDETRPS